MKRFRLVLVDDGNPLGADWHALDDNGDTICRSFGKWIAQQNAEALGYTLIEPSLGYTLYDVPVRDYLVNPKESQ